MSDRYQLTQHVATGGMAEVYVGVARGEEGFEKKVAVKRILPHLSKDAAVVRMFLSEARLAMHLHHQNIVEVLDVGKTAEGLFLVMELINGWDLADVISAAEPQGGIPAPLAAFIAAQVAAGLSHAYRRTIDGKPIILAHRDVSPANVLVSIEGEIKVADFGIARLEALSAGTDPGTFKGKVPYSAPELLAGKSANAASDQFALGLVLYELLEGRHPYGAMENMLSYVSAIAQKPVPTPSRAPPELVTVLAQALQKRPEDRFPTMEGFGRALSNYLAHAGVPASSAELSAFVSSLSLPPPMAERRGSTPDAALSFSLSPRAEPTLSGTAAGAAASSPYAQFLRENEWQPHDGPSLDASSGRVGSVGRAEPTLGPTTGAAWAQTGTPSFGAPAEESWANATGAASPPLGEDDKRPVWERQRKPTVGPARVVEEKLELARSMERAPAQDSDFVEAPFVEEPVKRGLGLGRMVMLMLTLAVLAFSAALFLSPKLRGQLPGLPGAGPLIQTEAKILYIDSDPSGANLTIDGQSVGQTPFVLENHYPPGEIRFELSLKGFKPHAGTFRGGEKVQETAKLRKR